MKKVFLILLAFLTTSQVSMAGCLNAPDGRKLCGPGQCVYDSNGEVVCSAFRGGGAYYNQWEERVLCGRGKCMRGQCSSKIGGNVQIIFNEVHCDGVCEEGWKHNCQDGE